MLGIITVILLVCLGYLPLASADTYCNATLPCAIGCCGQNNVCGLGPDYCSPGNCINNCDAKAECNPGDWPAQYVNATTCPLNVCCSEYGFCGTTEDFCGNLTVTRPSCDIESASLSRVIGYYNSAAATRGCGGMIPQSFPQGVYTHVYFAFGSIDPETFEVIPATAGDEILYPQFEALQVRDLGQKVWVSIGGWDFSDSEAPTATTFSDLAAADLTKQNAFFTSLVRFMNTWGFTGVDIDWEYPAADDRNGRPEDYSNYPTFLANLKNALNEYNFGLSITLPTSYWYLQHFDLVSIEPSVDWFNFMSYDLHGTWDIGSEWTGAYLDAHTNLTEIETALDLLWRNNITASKVNMGLAFYGRSFTLSDTSCTGTGCPYLSAGDAGPCSATAGVLFNSEIEQIISGNSLTPILDKDAAVKTISWNTDQWVSFDDQDTWKIKADFAKSECLGGVLVWSVDSDDNNNTFSKGLSAALGNQINLDTTTGLTLEYTDFSTGVTLSEQGNYCRFINCGEVCPNGFTTIVRGDETSQLMLDSTECPPGASGTQTLCCPTSSDVPTCQWRGFHNNGKCKGGCNSNEAEVGTISAGCSSGYQSACCTVTDSTTPWSNCQWSASCESDNTCPSGYSNFVVGSRDGWGGRPSCSAGKNYNYCCSGSIPDAFTNCEWTGHEVIYPNDQFCTDACPSGSIRIAEQWILGSIKRANTPNCNYGNEAYCCSGAPVTLVVPRGIPPIYANTTADEFDALLRKFLADPLCPNDWDSQYSATASSSIGSLLSTRATDQSITLSILLPLLAAWITSEFPRQDLKDIWDSRLADYGYANIGANASVLTDGLYGYSYDWSGNTVYSPMPLLAQTLCNIAESSSGLQHLATAAELLCELPGDSATSGIGARTLNEISMNDRTDDGVQPTVSSAIKGIINGELSLHYMRWLNTLGNNGNEITLELGFWIGSEPGMAPSVDVRSQYADRSHTEATDRWIMVHLHIPLDQDTIYGNAPGWQLGVRAMTFYHGQDIARPGVVTHGSTSDYRVEWRYSNTYDTTRNTGLFRNYNARTEALRCRTPSNRVYNGPRMYIGRSSNRPDNYAQLIQEFNTWLSNQGIFSTTTITRIWPQLAYEGPAIGWPTPESFDARGGFNPVAGAFDTNFMPDGSSAPDLSQSEF